MKLTFPKQNKNQTKADDRGRVSDIQDIREPQIRVPKKLWEMGMGERLDGDRVRCRSTNRQKPGISREVVRQRWRKLCSGEMAAVWRKA